ncbi:MAG: Abi-alpha family protein [Sinimarinibacterium sp.]
MARKALEDSSRIGVGMFRRATQALQSLPGADFVQRQLERIEQLLLTELKARMDRIEADMKPRQQQGFVVVGAMIDSGRSGSLSERMAALLERADTQGREQAYESLFHQFIAELVPDEARILGALSDGSSYALIHVSESFMGRSGRRIAENFANVGKPAGVKLLELVPAYVGHLLSLGLVETGAEDKSQEIKYQILESDMAVREVIQASTGSSGTAVRFRRHTLRITELGKRFWQACQPDAVGGEVIEGSSVEAQ